jgi:tetratricopeptide (TPR) repeat protein
MEAERLRGLLALQRGRLPQARAWLSRVDATVAGQSAPPLQARSHLDLATLELADGHADRAESHLRAARAGYAALGDRRGELAATQALGEVACRLGLWEEATRCLEEACQGWDADPDLHAATTCRLRLCEVAVMQQHGEGVAAHLAALRSTFEALGDIRALGQVSLTEGRLALGTGSSDEAGPLFARAAELADATEDWAGGTLARLGRGLAACAGGRGAEAAGWWREALARDARQRVEDVRVGPMLMQAARSSVGMGETELALALLESLRHKLSRNRDGGADSDLADEADWLVYELTEGTGSGVHMLGGGKPGEDDEG